MDDSNTLTTPNQLEIPAEIRTYLENILTDANISSVDETMHEELINELFARFDSFLSAKIIDNLPPEKVDEFIRMNEENLPQDQIQDYLMQALPDSENLVAQFFIEFRERYLGNVLIARDAQNQDFAENNATEENVAQNNEGNGS